MHFTRDPIIETIITPREGHRLVLRHTSQNGHEEYFVDMLEVIAFGSAYFYRCLDKPKPFVLPISDYEVLEVREQRIALKAPAVAQKGIKIAGGQKETKQQEDKTSTESKNSRRKRRIRKKTSDDTKEEETSESMEENVVVERPVLIPPPSTLISETIAKYKEMTAIEELALEEDFEPATQDLDNDQGLS